MKHKFFIFIFSFFILAAGAASAQRRATLTGVVANAQTREPIVGALVITALEADSTKVQYMVSGAGGVFQAGVWEGRTSVSASLVGYETLKKSIEVTAPRTESDTLFLNQGTVIDAVVKTAVAMRTSLEGDTLIYNADSYKVATDADVGSLLQKMPGFNVESGVVEAQGEQVKKVLIDGREFFGEDVAAAIASLPAESVKSVEVFDKLSDNAEFTGIDDGQGYKAINITTRESMRQAVLGQVSGLYGVEPPDKRDKKWHHYGLMSGNVSVFHGDAKISFGGTVNNLNERHFTSDDILGAGDNDGVATVGRFQINYIDALGKKNEWEVDATYRYNITDADDEREIEREYFETGSSQYRNYFSRQMVGTLNQNHIFRARINYKPTKFTELRIRPFLRYQSNYSNSTGREVFYPANDTDPDVELDNSRFNEGTATNTGLNLNLRTRLGRPGRTLSLWLSGYYNSSDKLGESLYDKVDGTQDGERSLTKNWGYNVNGGINYTEPINATSLVNLEYSIGYNYADNDRRSYLWDDAGDYSTTESQEYSGVYNSGYTVHKVGPGYRLQIKQTTFSVGAFYQYSALGGKTTFPLGVPDKKNRFHNFTYSAMVNSKFGTGGSSLRLFLFSRTQNPSVSDLQQDVVDISSSQNVRRGNASLRPTYYNQLRTRLILPWTEKGQTLSFQLGFSYALNSIAQSTISESEGYEVKDSDGNTVQTLDAVGRYTQPTNMDGEWNIRFGADYGFPIEALRSNLNLTAMVSYNSLPSRLGKMNDDPGTLDVQEIDWTTNRSGNLQARVGFVLGSNISEKIDFRVGYNISYNNVTNTFSKSSNSDFLRHRASAEFKFILPLDFTIFGTVAFSGYSTLSGENYGLSGQNYVIANFGIGKKVFRNRQGEVSVFINDAFNMNTSFHRNVYAQYVQNEINSVIGRYVGVKFTWNIRYFGKNGSQNLANYDYETHAGRNHAPGGGHGRPRGW